MGGGTRAHADLDGAVVGGEVDRAALDRLDPDVAVGGLGGKRAADPADDYLAVRSGDCSEPVTAPMVRVPLA